MVSRNWRAKSATKISTWSMAKSKQQSLFDGFQELARQVSYENYHLVDGKKHAAVFI